MKILPNIRTHFLRICIYFVLLIQYLFVFSISPIFAQDSPDISGVSISPVIFELQSDPDGIITNQMKVTNPTNFAQTVTMLVEDFVPIGEEGEVALKNPTDNDTFSIAKWTTVEPEEFTIAPGKSQYITFTIALPRNAEPGGHYGSIVALVSGGTSEITGSSVATKRGALILLKVSGDIEEHVDVQTFQTKNFQEYGPVEFNLAFSNTGNVHVRPAGFITITDLFGKQVAEIEIPANNVIPDAVRKANTVWDKKNLAGRYTATLVATYGTATKQTVTSVITFTVFPVKRALVALAVITVFFVLIYLSRRRLSLAFKILIGKK